MGYFPDQLFEILADRAGDNSRDNSVTKQLLEKGGATIIRRLVEESGQVAGAAMEQDIDLLVEEVADLWYYSLVLLLYFGLTPDQVERRLVERDEQKAEPNK